MKPRILILTGLALLTAAAGLARLYIQQHSQPDTADTAKPAQNFLFLCTYETYQNGIGDSTYWAQVITVNGSVIPVTDLIYDETGRWRGDWNSWYAQREEIAQQSSEQTIPDDDLAVMQSFVNAVNAGRPLAEKSKDYESCGDDCGQYRLFLMSPYDTVSDTLCGYGESTFCKKDKETKAFCNWMIQNGYFEAWETYK